MRRPFALLLAAGAALPACAPAWADEVTASAPVDVSVTVYRSPGRNGGSLALDSLGGFAVITETRQVDLPEGTSRLRFEGVVDGIIAESAMISGLPGAVIEKNRDAALLSPSALMRAALGRDLAIRRTDPATGKVRVLPAKLRSASEDGVVLETAEGIQALRCSGLPETFRYDRGAEGLSALPVLSVTTRARRAGRARVTLTYIAEGFDWSAAYTAHINPDGQTMDLGGWITLANGNSVSLKDARTQIVAGGLNREYVARFINDRPAVVAKCWPMQTTSDIPEREGRPYALVRPYGVDGYAEGGEDIIVTSVRRRGDKLLRVFLPAPPIDIVSAPPPPPPPPPEQLGDLKLYRVPQRTTVAAMQMKQTRLVEQPGVRFERVLRTRLPVHALYRPQVSQPAILLRTVNDKAHGLGLPLPSGAVLFDQEHGGRTMVVGQPDIHDTAEDEKLELELGTAADVTVTATLVHRTGRGDAVPTDLPPEFARIYASGSAFIAVDVANSADRPQAYELRLDSYGKLKVKQADHDFVVEDGNPIFRLTLPANDRVTLRFALQAN